MRQRRPARGQEPPKLLLGRFETDGLDWWRETEVATYDALWGGEPAAAHWTGTLKPGTLTLYAEKVPTRLLLDRGLRKNDLRLRCCGSGAGDVVDADP